jgi:hypothetical protein
MHRVLRFWLVLAAVAVGGGALGVLALAFVFPDVPRFRVGTAGRLAVTLSGVTAFAVIVWSGVSEDGTVGPSGR